MIRIRSKKDGFRRCGIAHQSTPTDYPADRFSKKELAALKAEPMLVVEEIDDPPAENNPEDMTVAQLKEELEGKIEIPANARKADLVQMVISARNPAKAG